MERFFQNRGSASIMSETLIGCLKLYASEILDKGLKELIDSSAFHNMSIIYDYYKTIGEVDLLKLSMCQLIEVFQ